MCVLVQDAPNFLIFRKKLGNNGKGVNMSERNFLCTLTIFVSKYILLSVVLFQQGHLFFEGTDIFETLKE